MTNFEHYKDKICEILLETGLPPAIKNGKPCVCKNLTDYCGDCDFQNNYCETSLKEWLNAEYIEPPIDWIKVDIDTPILVKDYKGNMWFKRYFAGFFNGKVWAWTSGKTSFSVDSIDDRIQWSCAKLAEEEE